MGPTYLHLLLPTYFLLLTFESFAEPRGLPSHDDLREKGGMKSSRQSEDVQENMLIRRRRKHDSREHNPNFGRLKRQAIAGDSYKWLKGVNYYFDKNTRQVTKDAFIRAAKEWEADTCINFTQNERAVDAIHVVELDGVCESRVGKVGRHQKLYLGNGCEWFGHATHEIGHALGFHHTQNRHDRDKHLNLSWPSIPKDHRPQYRKTISKHYPTYGLPYDYGSVMHYGSPRENPTMIPTKPNYEGTIGSPMISFIDLSMINEHYHCKDICKAASTDCKNGGFKHPRNCSKCICPGGYGGDLCNEKPNDGGSVLNATTEWQSLMMFHINFWKDINYMKITHWIKPSAKRPQNTTIDVKISYLNSGLDVEGCVRAGVEIKTNPDQRLTGHRCISYTLRDYELQYTIRYYMYTPSEEQSRFCSKKDLNVVLSSPWKMSDDPTHVVPVILYAYSSHRRNGLIARLDYRYRCDRC